MERATGKFQKLAKPKFDPDNPNAILGEIEVPGLEQVCMAAHTQIHPKREAVQMVKEHTRSWCAAENLAERSVGGRRRRTWEAYEYTVTPSYNRTADSEVLGMNVGLCVNDTRIDVCVDFGDESEAPDIQQRLTSFMAGISAEANAVFGYADDIAARGRGTELGPWKKLGHVNSWRKWVELDSGKPFPPSAVSVFRVVQANWALPKKIAAAMSFTASWCTKRFEESMAEPEPPLLRVEVFHSYTNPHVIKIMESYTSAEAFREQYRRHYNDYLDGVAEFRAAVTPTIQCYTPLRAGCRPTLSARLGSGEMMPLIAIAGAREGVAPSPEVLLEGLKVGIRHVVLEAGSTGFDEAIEALDGALALGLVDRSDVFLSLVIGEDWARGQADAGGLGAAVLSLLASRSGESSRNDRAGPASGRLGNADVLVLSRENGRCFDDDECFADLWERTRQAAATPVLSPPSEVALLAALSTATADGTPGLGGAPPVLARHVGIGGRGPSAFELLAGLVENAGAGADPDHAAPHSSTEAPEAIPGAGRETVPETVGVVVPGIVPSVFMGDLRAGDGATAPQAIELCHRYGVQPFSLCYAGGERGEDAGRAAQGAADFEHERVTADDILAKWVLELGAGVLMRPVDAADVSRTLTLSRFFVPPEWIAEIARKGGCPDDAWAPTFSRLLPPEGNPSREEIAAEVEETLAQALAAVDDSPYDFGQWEEDED